MDLEHEIESEEETSFLVVVIDLHAKGWAHADITLAEVLPNLLVFLNAHLALNSANGLAIYGYNGQGNSLIYSTTDDQASSDSQVPLVQGSDIPQFANMNNAVIKGIQQIVSKQAQSGSPTENITSVSGPISLALTFLNKVVSQSSVKGHILIVSAGGDDVGSKYINTMNTVFTAQKLKVPLDVANFGPPRSFLQQAAEFTEGSYTEFNNSHKDSLVHYFNSTFLVDPGLRDHINLATKRDVDFSAVCFLTKKILEIGYVCSVCLCIMDHVPNGGKCPVCLTNYESENKDQNNG